MKFFDTEETAEDCALYLCSCARDGAETLRLSNPGDYDYDEDDYEAPEYEIHRGGGLNRPRPVPADPPEHRRGPFFYTNCFRLSVFGFRGTNGQANCANINQNRTSGRLKTILTHGK